MSSELERLSRSSRRVLLFWLFVTVVLLAYCLFGAFVNDPSLLSSWRGALLLFITAAYLAWYATWTLKHFFRKDHAVIGAGPIPWRPALVRWGCFFGLLCAM